MNTNNQNTPNQTESDALQHADVGRAQAEDVAPAVPGGAGESIVNDALPSDGGGGPSIPRVGVKIGSPENGAVLTGPAGKVPIVLSGIAEITGSGMIDGVQVQLGDGKFEDATFNHAHFAVWKYSTNYLGPEKDDLKITVKAWTLYVDPNDPDLQEADGSHDITVSVKFDTTAPQLAIDSLPNDGKVLVPSGPSAPIQIGGTATDQQSGVASVQWTYDDGQQGTVNNTGGPGTWNWSFPLNVTLDRSGPKTHTLTVQAADRSGNVSAPQTVQITPIETSLPDKPSITSHVPPNILGAVGQGADLTITGTAHDSQSQVVKVGYLLDPTSGSDDWTKYTPAAPVDGSFENWTTTIHIPDFGVHKIYFRCADAYGNLSDAETVEVEVVVPVSVQDTDPVSPWAYLQDLLDFANTHVRINNTGVSAQHLQAAFYQPYNDPRLKTSNEPVNRVRLVVEVLRAYLADLGKSPSGSSSVPQSVLQDLEKQETAYCLMAYQTLLLGLGTSYEELRLTRLADDASRASLADRLGIGLSPSRPDELDALLLTPAKATEQTLEGFFGLADTRRDPLASVAAPQLLSWQRARLRDHWHDEDYPKTPGASLTNPIIDPDLIGEQDLIAPTPSSPNPAHDLFTQRSAWVAKQLSTLDTDTQPGEDEPTRLDRLAGKVLGQGMSALLALDARRQAGEDITADLQSLRLSPETLSYLVEASKLASAQPPLLDHEWENVYSILVQAQKLSQYDSWRNEEQQENITLSPEYFQMVHGQGLSIPPATDSVSWRVSWRARQQWQNTLAARIDQENSTEQALNSAVAAAETQALPLLRDALVKAIGDTLKAIDNKFRPADDDHLRNDLTQRLCIDVSSGGQETTRLDQAIETLQSVFFALRAARFGHIKIPTNPAASWSLLETSDEFDQEWDWMGSYPAWRGAMRAFLYPENLLLPSLLEAPSTAQFADPEFSTQAFQDWVTSMRDTFSRLTPEQARKAASSDPSAKPRDYLSLAKNDQDFPQDLKDGKFPIKDASGNIVQWIKVISDQLSDAQLLEKAELAGSLATKYPRDSKTGNPTAPLKYAQEVFYWVPLHLALQLQQAGQYAAALDWFHSVYAYTLPHDNRKVYAALLPEQASSTYTRALQWLVDLNPHAVAETRAYPYTRFVLLSLTRCMLDYADAQFTSGTLESMGRARELYLLALDLLDQPELQDGQPQNPPSSTGPVAPNPALAALRQHAEANLAKIRGGRNIAGMRYQPALYLPQDGASGAAASNGGQVTYQPTPYRYSVLMERTKQLAGLAQQMEAQYLSVLQHQDSESYNLFKARQDLETADANLQLQQQRVQEANDSLALAWDQALKAQSSRDHYTNLINGG